MTARIEPSVDAPVGMFAGLFGTKQSVKSHEAIMTDALQGFTQAVANLDQAHATIEAQIEQHRLEAARHEVKAQVAGESLSRLARVRERISDLIA